MKPQERRIASRVVYFDGGEPRCRPGDLVERRDAQGEPEYVILSPRGRGFETLKVPPAYARFLEELLTINGPSATGRRTSEKKAAASRANGRKGGAPRRLAPDLHIKSKGPKLPE